MNGNSLDRGIKSTVDWVIVGCYVAIVLFGVLNIYASIQSSDPSSILQAGTKSCKQLLWFGISLAAAALILFVFSARLWEIVSAPAYLLVLLLLIAVIVVGGEANGSKSWFELGPVKFQPCELSKITTSLMLASFMSRPSFKLNNKRDLLIMAAIVGIPTLAILAEKETGTVLVYAGFLFMFYREGLSGWILGGLALTVFLFILTLISSTPVALAVFGCMVLILFIHYFRNAGFVSRRRTVVRNTLAGLLLGVAFIFSTGFVYDNVLQPHQQRRIAVLLGLQDDPMGAGYNVRQSMIAIGSGGLWGKGFLQGTQTAYGFVPEQSTDFIFCTVGEEWGFAGSVLLLLVYCFMIYRIIRDADESRVAFTRIFGYCTASCLFMHLFINIGMTIKLSPVIGIPLPFMSYGGSSLLAFTVMLFIFLALDRQEKKYF